MFTISDLSFLRGTQEKNSVGRGISLQSVDFLLPTESTEVHTIETHLFANVHAWQSTHHMNAIF